MRKDYKTRIEKAKAHIKRWESKKKCLIEFVDYWQERLKSGEVSQVEYSSIVDTTLKNRSLGEWVKIHNDEINKGKKEISDVEWEKSKEKKNSRLEIAFMATLITLFVFGLILPHSNVTGRVVDTHEIVETLTIDQTYSNTGELDLVLYKNITSFKISGKLIGNGSAEITMDGLMVYTTTKETADVPDTPGGLSSITGQVIGENSTNSTDEIPTEDGVVPETLENATSENISERTTIEDEPQVSNYTEEVNATEPVINLPDNTDAENTTGEEAIIPETIVEENLTVNKTQEPDSNITNVTLPVNETESINVTLPSPDENSTDNKTGIITPSGDEPVNETETKGGDEVKGLQVIVLDRECVDTCGLDNHPNIVTLRFELMDGMTLNLSTITYTYLEEIEVGENTTIEPINETDLNISLNETFENETNINTSINLTELELNLSLNLTELNVSLNQTENLTLNLTENLTVVENLTLNLTENITENMTVNMTINLTIPVLVMEIENINIFENQTHEIDLLDHFIGISPINFMLSKNSSSATIYGHSLVIYSTTAVNESVKVIAKNEFGEIESNTFKIDIVRQAENLTYNNTPPVLVRSIPDLFIMQNRSQTFNLTEFFKDNESLTYHASYMVNGRVNFEGNMVEISPDNGFIGQMYIVIFANDTEYETASNIFTVEVYEKLTDANLDTFIANIKDKFGMYAAEKNISFENISIKKGLISFGLRKEESGSNVFIDGITYHDSVKQLHLGPIDDDRVISEVIAFNEFPFKKAKIVLSKNDYVTDILKCPEFNFETRSCPNWQVSNITPMQNLTHVWFEVTDFSAYAASQISHKESEYITPESMYLNSYCPRCEVVADCEPELFCPIFNSGQDNTNHEVQFDFNILSLPDYIKSAELCSYRTYLYNQGTPTNYIKEIEYSTCSNTSRIDEIDNTWSSAEVTGDGWNCIDITPFMLKALSNKNSDLYVAWIGDNAGGGRGPYSCFTGYSELDVCGGNNPSGADDCRPYVRLRYE